MKGTDKIESKNWCEGLIKMIYYDFSKLNRNPLVIMAPIMRYSTVNKGWTLSFILCKYDIEHADAKAATRGSKYTNTEFENVITSLFPLPFPLPPNTIITTPRNDTMVSKK